jgi:hypothetical protein
MELKIMSRIEDRKIIEEISKDKISDFMFMHLRNMWSVDGLYYIFIEEEYGTDVATEIDRKVWEVMGKIEARRLKEILDINGDDINNMIFALKHSGWALDLEEKDIQVKDNKAFIRNTKCRVQSTRLKKGLKEFSCKQVRSGFLRSFAKEFNANIELRCNVCPPDDHPRDLWCEWIFEQKKE